MKKTITILTLIISMNCLFSQVNNSESVEVDSALLEKITDLNNQLYPDSVSDSIVVTIYDLTDLNIYYSSIDLSSWDTLKECGLFNEQNLKTGFWIEFPIDTNDLLDENFIRYDTSIAIVFKPDITKQIGEYIVGKRNGEWSIYEFDLDRDKWILKKIETYSHGIKNGIEKYFSPIYPPGIPLMETDYKNGKEIEIRTFYMSGQIETKIQHNGKEYIRFYYDENGKKIGKEKSSKIYF